MESGGMRQLLQHPSTPVRVRSQASATAGVSKGRMLKPSHTYNSTHQPTNQEAPRRMPQVQGNDVESRFQRLESRLFDLEQENRNLRDQVERQNTVITKTARHILNNKDTIGNEKEETPNTDNEPSDPLQLANVMFGNSKVLEKERQKSAVLFTEVVRLGKELSQLQVTLSQGNQQQLDRISKLETRIEAREGRIEDEQSKSRTDVALSKAAAASLVSKVKELQDVTLRLETSVAAEMQQRSNMGVAQRTWFETVKGALISNDIQLTDKLEDAFREVQSQVSVGQSSERHFRALERAELEGKQRDVETGVQRELSAVSSRFTDIDYRIEQEGNRREQQVLVMQQFMDRSLQRLQITIGEEEVRRNDAILAVQQDLESTVSFLKSMIQSHINESDASRVALEEVLRAEVRARTRHEARDREHLQNIATSLGVETQQAKQDVLDKLEDLERAVKSEFDANDVNFSQIQRDMEVVLVDRVRRSEYMAVKTTCDMLETRFAAEHANRETQYEELSDKVTHVKEACEAVNQTIKINHEHCTSQISQLHELFDNVSKHVQTSLDESRIETERLVHNKLGEMEHTVKSIVESLESKFQQLEIDVMTKLDIHIEASERRHEESVSEFTMHKMVSKVDSAALAEDVQTLKRNIQDGLLRLSNETKSIREEHSNRLELLAQSALEQEVASKEKFGILDGKIGDQNVDILSLRAECMKELHEHHKESITRDETVGYYAQEVEVRQVMDRLIADVVQLNLENASLKHESYIRHEQEAGENRYQELRKQVEESASQLQVVEARVQAKLDAMSWARKARQQEWDASVSELNGSMAIMEEQQYKIRSPGSPMGANIGPTVADVGFPLRE